MLFRKNGMLRKSSMLLRKSGMLRKSDMLLRKSIFLMLLLNILLKNLLLLLRKVLLLLRKVFLLLRKLLLLLRKLLILLRNLLLLLLRKVWLRKLLEKNWFEQDYLWSYSWTCSFNYYFFLLRSIRISFSAFSWSFFIIIHV